MINAFVSWILSFILKIFDYILGAIFMLFENSGLIAGFTDFMNNASNYLHNFYGYIMRLFMLVRSVLDINSFEMHLIVELLTVTILHRPLILVVKLIVRWFKNIKL